MNPWVSGASVDETTRGSGSRPRVDAVVACYTVGMQTFLPFPDLAKSAHVLDMKRLGKQRVETKQILNVLCGVTKGWANHPAVRMWEGHEAGLATYGLYICAEWKARGYKDTLYPQFLEVWIDLPRVDGDLFPWWLGDVAFHASHRSNLLRKDPDWYGAYGWDESPDLEYVWPTADLVVT